MEFLLTLIIILILLIIHSHLKKDPVYRDSPADPNYRSMRITILIVFKKINDSIKPNDCTIKNTYYISKKLRKSKDICDYIIKHPELFKSELDDLRQLLKKEYDTIPSVDTITVMVEKD